MARRGRFTALLAVAASLCAATSAQAVTLGAVNHLAGSEAGWVDVQLDRALERRSPDRRSPSPGPGPAP